MIMPAVPALQSARILALNCHRGSMHVCRSSAVTAAWYATMWRRMVAVGSLSVWGCLTSLDGFIGRYGMQSGFRGKLKDIDLHARQQRRFGAGAYQHPVHMGALRASVVSLSPLHRLSPLHQGRR